MVTKFKRLLAGCALASLTLPLAPAALAQDLALNEAEYLETRGVNYLVFSNWYDGLFADSKISGVEIVHQGVRTATNGDVRLSATPGQWDPIGRMVERTVDPASGAINVLLEYPEHDFRYRIRVEPRGEAAHLSVILDQPLPAALAGKAGFNLEFLPAAYFHRTYMADGKAGTFPLHPSSDMVAGGERQPSSGRDVGPGAEPLPMATGRTLVLAPEDSARRVTLTSATAPLAMYDGRNQAQNGWFVVRSELPAGQTGAVLEWTIQANSVPDWVRPPVIGHSQLGYAPEQRKVAVIELDPNAQAQGDARLLRVGADGTETEALAAAPVPWGRYLRYDYRTFDFSDVREPGVYLLEYAGKRTAAFRIAPDIYADAWHPSMDVYMPVQMDHMLVNEAYRVWQGDPHRDDARQAPLNHEHIDLYRQGPTTDTRFAPGEHIPGLAVGGWLDAGDFDQRTQTQYAVVRTLVDTWERHRPERDTTLIDQDLRRVEMHVPDGAPDYLQQIEHGVLQLAAQFDAVGFAVHGIVEPNVAQYTHLGDAASKTDGLIYDPSLAFGEVKDGRSGTPDDRWVFTSRSSSLNYGSAAALAAASRALRGYNDELADKALGIAARTWADEHGREPFTFRHGNTTGGPLDTEEFTAAVELLIATREPQYAARVGEMWPDLARRFGQHAGLAIRALPHMPASFREQVEAAARTYLAGAPERARANPYGVPITEGGWAGNGAVMNTGLIDYHLHKAFPHLTDGSLVFKALDYLHGTHPESDLSFVSGVGTQSKEVAYGFNRADFSFIAGGVVPGVLIVKPDLPENSEIWPFFWGQNEYVVPMSPIYVALVHAAMDLLEEQRAGQAAVARQEPWRDLVEGGSLAGWRTLGGSAPFTIEGGEVVGRSVLNSPNSWLATEETFGDFILEYEARVDPRLNSGVMIRGLSRADYRDGKVHGYQAEIDSSSRAWSGGIYDEERRGWLNPLTRNPAAQRAFKVGEWNSFRVEAIGERIRTWVNGVPAANLVDGMTPRGFIALQVHSVPNDPARAGLEARFRNIRVITSEVATHAMPSAPSAEEFSYPADEPTASR